MSALSLLGTTTIRGEGLTCSFEPPVDIEIRGDSDGMEVVVEELGVRYWYADGGDSTAALLELVAFLWDEYAEANPEELNSDALALREKLRLRMRVTRD